MTSAEYVAQVERLASALETEREARRVTERRLKAAERRVTCLREALTEIRVRVPQAGASEALAKAEGIT